MGALVDRNPEDESFADHRVLIVEDELFIALDLEDTVKAMGFNVAGLANGKDQAMRLAPLADIAFVDVNLVDGATGPEIGRRLVEDYGITVVFMTGNPEVVEGRVAGALGVVTKPAMPSAVEKTLRRAVEARRSLF
ncbi:response regulator (plasmid) [Rhizobium grahamii]|uniref:Response regulator n=1 Tax=Rhizobium grahamii TaxID=1120045 RepID=A0A5Q0CF88_9HYPH|nr:MULTISPECIES: response regulator [Rhizobium]QFY62611.1 response regulator [Rhizobium grahamii]QRM52649.1 response regulator [Rhizobium sp. BG6]